MRNRRNGVIRVLVAAVAVLLPAGALAATTVGSPTVARDGRVGATGLSAAELEEERARATSSTSVTVTPAPPPPALAPPGPTTGPVPAAPTTRAPPGATTPTLPPGAPLPPTGPPPTGIPNIEPASSWSVEGNGVTARIRLEPASPVAGQPVRFRVDVSSTDPCCTIMLDFGDGSNGFSMNNGRPCESSPPLRPGPLSTVATHTYAAAGAYKASLNVFSGDSCANPPLAPGAPPPPPFIGSAAISACVGVGPGSAAQQGCSPFPTVGPGSIISPVLDPFCQLRSDCTQASSPR